MKWYIIIIVIIIILSVIYLTVIYPLFLRNTLRKLSVELFTSLNKYQVDYWVDFGTLLGIIRENDIIWWDGDIDVVVVDSPQLHEKMKLVKADLAKKGYKINKQNWKAYRSYKWGIFYADLYINSIDYNKGVYVGATGNNGSSDIPINYIGSCNWIIWKKFNIPVRVPEKIHETLVWRYGDDYMTPKKSFKGRDS